MSATQIDLTKIRRPLLENLLRNLQKFQESGGGYRQAIREIEAELKKKKRPVDAAKNEKSNRK